MLDTHLTLVNLYPLMLALRKTTNAAGRFSTYKFNHKNIYLWSYEPGRRKQKIWKRGRICELTDLLATCLYLDKNVYQRGWRNCSALKSSLSYCHEMYLLLQFSDFNCSHRFRFIILIYCHLRWCHCYFWLGTEKGILGRNTYNRKNIIQTAVSESLKVY